MDVEIQIEQVAFNCYVHAMKLAPYANESEHA